MQILCSYYELPHGQPTKKGRIESDREVGTYKKKIELSLIER